jgi:putative zinc finger/helix-turn-helix YgiT family protein
MTGKIAKCVACGKPGLRDDISTETLVVGGVTFTTEVPAQICDGCGETFVTAEALAKADRVMAGELARLGQRSQESFRFMRKALGMKASDLAELLDVSPETVARWESGSLTVEPRAFALLGGLVTDLLEGRDGTLARLRAVRSPSPVSSPIRVRVA